MRNVSLLSFVFVAACSAASQDPGTGSSNTALSGDGKPTDSCGGGDPKPPACKTIDEPDPKCDDKEGYLEQCKELGLELTSIVNDGKTCTVSCCEPPTPSPPPPTSCTWSVLGDGKTCTDYGTLKEEAAKQCGAGTLQAFDTSDDCPGGATAAKVECCSSK